MWFSNCIHHQNDSVTYGKTCVLIHFGEDLQSFILSLIETIKSIKGNKGHKQDLSLNFNDTKISIDTNEFDEEPLRRQMRQAANDLEHSEELEAVEDQSSDNDSQNGILADDNMKPCTSRMATNEGGAQFSNDNFEIKIKKIGFKKYTKFNFCDILYNVHLNSKPGQSTVLLKDAIEGLLQSIANILEDLKSQIDGSNNRILHLVSQCASKTLKFK